jgi:hypothetical protein
MRIWSWASNEFSTIRDGAATVIHSHIRSYSVSDAVESELVRGAGRDIIGTTDPIYVPGDFSFDMLAKWWRTFIADVTDNGSVYLGDLDFKMVVKRKLRSETTAMVDAIEFQILGGEDSAEQGTSAPLITTVTCLPTKVKRNGVQL